MKSSSSADGAFALKELVPVAGPDVAATRENTEVMIDMLANDTVPAGETVILTGVGNAANGMVTINDDGTLTYRPNDYWSGRDSFTYSLSDGKHGTTTGTVTVEVSAVADKPLLSVDGTLHAEVKSTEPTLVALDISANLVDLDGSENLTVMISEVPAGVTFTAGKRDDSGNWILQPSDLGGLQMILPAAFADNFTLAVAARAVETSNFSLASTHQTVDVKLTQAPTSDIVVHASGDSYKGAAVFSLWVDGAKIGQSVSVEASHKAGQWQDFVFNLAKGSIRRRSKSATRTTAATAAATATCMSSMSMSGANGWNPPPASTSAPARPPLPVRNPCFGPASWSSTPAPPIASAVIRRQHQHRRR